MLIVDDHRSFRRFARRLIESAGYEVVGEAADGASALAQASALAPAIVLLDVLLPDRDGFGVARELVRSERPPVVLLTSSRARSDLEAGAGERPAVPFISKSDLTAARFGELAGAA